MSFTADVVIVGAGIVGAACAMELAKEKFRVTVVDGSFAGSGATAAGMGHIVVMDDSEAQFALTQYSVKLWRDLSPELPADCEYETRGSVWVAAAPDEMGKSGASQLTIANAASTHKSWTSRLCARPNPISATTCPAVCSFPKTRYCMLPAPRVFFCVGPLNWAPRRDSEATPPPPQRVACG
jgi:glycine/D-amino acid oxidase-like deaminating enzyme